MNRLKVCLDGGDGSSATLVDATSAPAAPIHPMRRQGKQQSRRAPRGGDLSWPSSDFIYHSKRVRLKMSAGDAPIATEGRANRKLAAIVFTDIVGYTALMQSDEALAMLVLQRHAALLRPVFSKHNGREVKSMGDAFLVEFESALEATQCAVEIQERLH